MLIHTNTTKGCHSTVIQLSLVALSEVKGSKSVSLPRTMNIQMLLSLIRAHLKVRLCPAAATKSAVSAESVALST